MSHWITRYMTKDEFEDHITEEWNSPIYKGKEGPIKIENKTDSLRIVLVNTSQTFRTNRIQLERKTDKGVKELESYSYPSEGQKYFDNVIEWLEHFCNKSQNYL